MISLISKINIKNYIKNRLYSTCSNPKILICGAGIAGLTCALALKKKGISPVVIDLSPDNISQFKNQGIFLQGNGMKVLEKLGISEKVKKSGRVLTTSLMTNQTGYYLNNINLTEINEIFQTSCVGIGKDTLLKILTSEFGGIIRTKESIRKINVSTIDSEMGITCKLRNSLDLENFDVVIGADGNKSLVREMLTFPHTSKNTLWGIFQAIIDLPKNYNQETYTEMWGLQRRLFIIPIEYNKAYIWGTFMSKFPPNLLISGISKSSHEFIQHFSQFSGIPGLNEIFTNLSKVSCYNYFPLEVNVSKISQGGVVLIGDAAHAMAPNIPQGASLAMEDAYILAEEIASAVKEDKKKKYQTAIQNYVDKRKKRIENIQKMSVKKGIANQNPKNFLTASFSHLMWKIYYNNFLEKKRLTYLWNNF
jgi:2-polyprenyl-6-methoxyphenol hydroxylase-like FAD-dependent oxidoreductase